MSKDDFINFTQVLDWLLTPSTRPEVSKVERMNQALALLGDPQLDLPVIHVTGTNGKGSTIKLLEALLCSQQLSVGSFTSPHYERVNERIMRNQTEISDELFMHYANQVHRAEKTLQSLGYGSCGYFERYVLITCLYFNDYPVDCLIIEVGIGGLLDATNIFTDTLSVITTIDFDHMNILGETIEAIAAQKAGIIRPHSTTIVGALSPQALSVIQETVENKAGELRTLAIDFGHCHDQFDSQSSMMRFDWWSNQLSQSMDDLSLSLLGTHQIDNASLALDIFVWWLTNKTQQRIDWTAACSALQSAQWWGRMELMSREPMIYLDGAHNQAGIASLIHTLNTYFADRPLQLLYAGLKTKDQAQHLKLLRQLPLESLTVTTFDHPDAYSLADYLQLDPNLSTIHQWQDYFDSIDANDPTVTIVTGSLYFIARVRHYLIHADNK